MIEIDEEDRATMRFGDGAFGAIPPSGADDQGHLPCRRWAHRQCRRAGTIQTIVNAPQLALLGAKVTNPEPATGGAERESIEHAVMHAPAVFRSLEAGGDRRGLQSPRPRLQRRGQGAG